MQNDKNPFMPFVEDFEAEAESFLRKYCKEVLNSPQATPIRDIAQKQMNLDIVDTESLSSILCVLFLFACFIACLFNVYTIARVYENFKYYFQDFEIPILCTNIVVFICIFPTNTHNLWHANSTLFQSKHFGFSIRNIVRVKCACKHARLARCLPE